MTVTPFKQIITSYLHAYTSSMSITASNLAPVVSLTSPITENTKQETLHQNDSKCKYRHNSFRIHTDFQQSQPMPMAYFPNSIMCTRVILHLARLGIFQPYPHIYKLVTVNYLLVQNIALEHDHRNN